MAACPGSCTNYMPGTAKVWFKIQEEGLHSDGVTWASDQLIDNVSRLLSNPSPASSLTHVSYPDPISGQGSLHPQAWQLHCPPRTLGPTYRYTTIFFPSTSFMNGRFKSANTIFPAYQYPGAQWYPSCFQVTVTGSGTKSPSSSQLVAFPGAYTPTTPGVVFDIYQGPKTYTIPGPVIFTG